MSTPKKGDKVVNVNFPENPPREVVKVESNGFVHIRSSDGGLGSHVNKETFDKKYKVVD